MRTKALQMIPAVDWYAIFIDDKKRDIVARPLVCWVLCEDVETEDRGVRGVLDIKAVVGISSSTGYADNEDNFDCYLHKSRLDTISVLKERHGFVPSKTPFPFPSLGVLSPLNPLTELGKSDRLLGDYIHDNEF